MLLTDYLTPDTIATDLVAATREEALARLVGLLALPERSRNTALRLLARREALGSTAVGHGIAIPHTRSLIVPRVQMAYGRLTTPLPWDAPDGRPVRHVFLILAPPVEVSNQYLQTLGQVARLARLPDFRASLDHAASARDVLTALGA